MSVKYKRQRFPRKKGYSKAKEGLEKIKHSVEECFAGLKDKKEENTFVNYLKEELKPKIKENTLNSVEADKIPIYADGYDAGYQDGLNSLHNKSRKICWEEGFEEGKAQQKKEIIEMIDKVKEKLDEEGSQWENICNLKEGEKVVMTKNNWGTSVGEVVLRCAWQIHVLEELKKQLESK